jgi:deoxyribodipyrimidine photo-lyase
MTKNTAPILVWFRQDLRVKDNPALLYAHESGQPIIPLYILDDVNSGEWRMGGASRWWLHHSLSALSRDLEDSLLLESGDPETILQNLVSETGANKIVWNRCYEPWQIKRDKAIKQNLSQDDLEIKSFNGALLYEPHKSLKEDGTPYRVFTPFYKKGCLERNGQPRAPSERPKDLNLKQHKKLSLHQLELMPDITWYQTMQEEWTPGEAGAQSLKVFAPVSVFHFFSLLGL